MFNKIVKWVFLAFNALMLILVLQYCGFVGEEFSKNTGMFKDAQDAGTAIGSGIGTVFLWAIWIGVDIVLCLIYIVSKPKS